MTLKRQVQKWVLTREKDIIFILGDAFKWLEKLLLISDPHIIIIFHINFVTLW